MKTLYSILGVGPDASAVQIEAAYAELLAQFKDGSAARSGEDNQIRLVAIKEAYAVLSDPIKRQVYNQKLFAPETLPRPTARGKAVADESAAGSGIKKILLIGVLAIIGLSLYSYNAREREKMRIQHEHEVQMKAVQVLEDAQKQSAATQEALLDRQERLDANARERQDRAEQERFSREVEARRRQNEYAEQQRIQREKNEQRQAEYAAEAQRRQQVADAERIARRDKAELQRLEHDHYGRVVSR